VAAITGGAITFTKCIATPDMMPIVGRVARVRATCRLAGPSCVAGPGPGVVVPALHSPWHLCIATPLARLFPAACSV
jgi:hypothetical protein